MPSQNNFQTMGGLAAAGSSARGAAWFAGVGFCWVLRLVQNVPDGAWVEVESVCAPVGWKAG